MCHKKLKVGSKSNPATPVHQTIAALSEKITQGLAAPSTPMIQAPLAIVPVPRTPVAGAVLKRDLTTMMDGNDAANRRVRLNLKQPCTPYYSTMPRTPGAAAARTPVGAVECTPKIKHANTGGTPRTADLPAPLTPGIPAPTTPGIYGFTTPAPGTPGLSKLRLSSKTPSAFVDTRTDRNILRCPMGIHLSDPWCDMVLTGEKTWDIRGLKKPPQCPAWYNIIRKKCGIVGHVEVASFMEIKREEFDDHFDKHRVHRDHTYIYTYIHTDTIVRRLFMVCTTGEFDRVKWCGRRLGTGIGREEERL